MDEGLEVGAGDGNAVGVVDGLLEGEGVGPVEGLAVGECVGYEVGINVGTKNDSTSQTSSSATYSPSIILHLVSL